VLNSGVIEQVGAPLELYNHPQNRFVAGFLGSPKMNFLDARIEAMDASGAKLRAGGAAITLPRALTRGDAGDEVTFGVRPEHISIREGSGAQLADVKVDLVEQLGGQTMLYTTTADGQPLTISIDGQEHVDVGAGVTAYVDPSRYHVFASDGRAL
jgi:multiple sugar transport system ATP-binding protein